MPTISKISLEEAVTGKNIIAAAQEVATDLNLGMIVENYGPKKKVSFDIIVPLKPFLQEMLQERGISQLHLYLVRTHFKVTENRRYSHLPVKVAGREMSEVKNNKYPVKTIYNLPRGRKAKAFIRQEISDKLTTAIHNELKGDWEAGLINYWTNICGGNENNGPQYAAKALAHLKIYTDNPLELRASSRELGKIYRQAYGQGVGAYDNVLYLLQEKGILPTTSDFFQAARILADKLGRADGEQTFPKLIKKIEADKIKSVKDLLDCQIKKKYRDRNWGNY